MPQSGSAFQVLKDNSSGNRYKKITKVLILKAHVLNLVAVHSVRTVVFPCGTRENTRNIMTQYISCL